MLSLNNVNFKAHIIFLFMELVMVNFVQYNLHIGKPIYIEDYRPSAVFLFQKQNRNINNIKALFKKKSKMLLQLLNYKVNHLTWPIFFCLFL